MSYPDKSSSHDVAVAKRVAGASIAIPSAVAIARSATGAAIAVVSDVAIAKRDVGAFIASAASKPALLPGLP